MNKSLISYLCIILVLCSAFVCSTHRSEHMHFVVKLGKAEVGQLEAIQTVENLKTTYLLKSDVQIGLLLNLTIQEKITDVFERGNLHNSIHTRHINQELKANNTIIWDGDSYLLKNKDHNHSQLNDSIFASVLSVYFKEPVHEKVLYSHNYQRLLPIKAIGPHKYAVLLPTGKSTIYQYNNGELESVISPSNWGLIQFIRKPSH